MAKVKITKDLIDLLESDTPLGIYNLTYREHLRSLFVRKWKQEYIRPSALSYCSRKQYFSMTKGINPMKPDPILRSILDNGTYVHHRIQRVLRESGLLIERISCRYFNDKLCDFEVYGNYIDWCILPSDRRINIKNFSVCPKCGGKLNYSEVSVKLEDFLISLSIDGLLHINDESFLLEIKSIISRQFDEVKHNQQPLEKNKIQICMYLKFVNKEIKNINDLLIKQKDYNENIIVPKIKKIKRVICHYENKDTNRYESFIYEPTTIETKQSYGEYKKLKNCLDDEMIPKFEKDIRKFPDYECKNCPFLKICKGKLMK